MGGEFIFWVEFAGQGTRWFDQGGRDAVLTGKKLKKREEDKIVVQIEN